MSRILRRPMFRGGRVDSRGTGITSGLGYQAGGRVGYKSAGFVTGAELMDLARTVPELNKFKNMTINPKTRFKIGEGKMIGSPSGKFEGFFDVDRVASFRGTPGMQDLAFLLPGDAYNLSASLGSNEKKDDNELIASKDPNFIPEKKEEILFEDQDYLSTGEKLAKEREQRDKILKDQERMQDEQISESIRDDQKEKQYLTVDEQRKQTVDQPFITEEDTEIVGVQDDTLLPERQGIKEMADEYFKILSGETAERNKKALREARIADMSDYALQFFKGTQKEGATVGSAAAEVADYATKRPGRAEVLKEKFRAGEDRLREKGADLAIRESMSDEKGDLAYKRQRAMLEMRLDSAEDIAEKNRIAANLRTLNNQAFQRELKQMTIDAKDPQSALEKNVKYLAKKYDVDEKTAYKLYRGDPENFVAQLKADEKAKGFIDDKGFRMAAEEFYGNEFINDITLTEAPNVGDPAEGQKDGIYTDSSKRLIIEIKDEVVIKSRSYK
jgi:hypothetical protein